METALGHLTVALDIEGMSCASCVAHVEKALGAVDGVETVSVDLAARSALVTMRRDAGTADPGERLGAAVERAGYGVIAAEVLDAGDDEDRGGPPAQTTPSTSSTPSEPSTGSAPRRPATNEDLREAAERRAQAREAAERRTLAAERRDLALSALLSAPLLVLGMSHGAIPFAATEAGLLLQLALATVLVVIPGRRFFAGALAALRRKSADMNTLVALGVGAAYLYSALAVLVPSVFPQGPHGEHAAPHLYFEAAGAIVTFVLLGRLLESRARRKLSDAVRGLVTLIPKTAVRVGDQADLEVPLSAIVAGDLIRVRPGERVPADGVVVSGHATLDESVMTGESAPVEKSHGDKVAGGTLALNGGLVVRVTGTGEKSALGRIITAVERARGERAPISRLADRVSAVFVPIVIGLAIVTFFVWLAVDAAPGVDPLQVALERMIAVLVIACPCALGLATPAAVAVGMGRGAELGILFRGGASLEALSRVDEVLLDKTGTLTLGAPEVADVMHLGSDADRALMLSRVAALERMSEHPVAQAIARHTPSTLAVVGFESKIGGGVSGRVDGVAVLAGTESLLAARGVDTAPLTAAARAFAQRGQTPVLVAIATDRDGSLAPAGVIAVADRPRPESRAVVAELGALGANAHMVTGDRREAAAFIAAELGIDPIRRVDAEVDPEGKAELVTRLQAEGRVVAMVGDGVNDAPALATADVGVAVASGTDIATAAADVTLARGVGTLPTSLRLAKRTLATIRRNLFWAFAYNVVGVPLAAGVFVPVFGWTLSPVFASLAMSLSSVSVLLSSLALRRFKPSGPHLSTSGLS